MAHHQTGSHGSSSLKLLIPGKDGYQASRSSVGADSWIGRAITPVSELNSAIVVLPDPIMQKSSIGVPNMRMQYDHSRSSSEASLQSTLTLPPPPRRTRSPVARQPSLDAKPAVKDTWSNIEIEKGLPSPTSDSMNRHGSFGVAPPSRAYLSNASNAGWHNRHGSDPSVRSSSSPRGSLGALTHKKMTPRSLDPMSPPHDYDSESFSPSLTARSSRFRAASPHVPSDVDIDDFGSVSASLDATDFRLSHELGSQTQTVAPPHAWATLVTNAAMSNGLSAPPRNVSRSASHSAVPVPQVLQPRTTASARAVRTHVAEPTTSRGNNISSNLTGDVEARVREGPSKQAVLSSVSSISRRTELAHAPSNSVKPHHF